MPNINTIHKDEATAAERRIPFFLWQTDGLTPATGQTGTCTLSKNGAASAASTNSITEIGGGWYYLELTAAEVDTAGFVAGYYDHANTVPSPFLAFVSTADPQAAELSATDIADAVLKRDFSLVSGESRRSLMNFARGGLGLNKVTITGGVASVKEEDDATEAFTVAISGSTPVTGTDPS